MLGKDPLYPKPVTDKVKRVYDTTPLTEQQIEYIQNYKKVVDSHNAVAFRKDYITQDDMTKALNDEFGLNKATSTYRRYWSQPKQSEVQE